MTIKNNNIFEANTIRSACRLIQLQIECDRRSSALEKVGISDNNQVGAGYEILDVALDLLFVPPEITPKEQDENGGYVGWDEKIHYCRDYLHDRYFHLCSKKKPNIPKLLKVIEKEVLRTLKKNPN